MRWRIAISAAIGLASGLFCWFLMKHFHQDAADLRWAIHAAQRLLAHQNPYDTPLEQYPLTAAFFALPFVRLQPEVAAGLFYGIGSALLAFGLTRRGYERLLIFLAYPYWAGMIAVQWSPIIMAGAFFPLLLPVTMAKPQIGLPVFLTHMNRRGILACVGLGVLSLLLMPAWPLLWLGQMGNYQHFIPLLVLPGPLLLLALLRYRDRDAILLFLSALMPQRWFFDSFILWLIPKSRREILGAVFFSWGVGIWRWYHIPHTMHEVGLWTILGFYLPMLVVVLLRARHEAAPDSGVPSRPSFQKNQTRITTGQPT
ncbi:MAG: hypothetical protein ACHP78_18165 [Terriglobales bacterium]